MDMTRQYDLIDPMALEWVDVTVIGTGGIGSATLIALAKMGIQYFYVYEDDLVEGVNIPSQLLRVSDIGKPKAQAVVEIAKLLAGEVHGLIRPSRVRASTVLPPSAITISAVDSINARKAIWQAVSKSEIRWYLDARMGAEMFQLYTVDMTVADNWYLKYILSLQEDEVPEDPCTARATIYTAFMAAGHIAHQAKRIIMGQDVPKVIIHDIANMKLLFPGGRYDSRT